MNLRPLLAGALAALIAAAPAGARAAGIKLVAIVAASGVRVPDEKPLRPYASRPWPHWSLAPGTLTAHGAQLLTALGAYYRARYARSGLFGASGCNLDAYAYAGTPPAQRASAQALLDGFAPGCNVALAGATATPDPVFAPIAETTPGPNPELAPGDRATLTDLDSLLDCASNGCHRIATLAIAADAVAALRAQYDDGLAGAHVGWGHLDAARLRELNRLPVLRERLDDRSPSAAHAKASNLAAQLITTLQRRKGFAAFVGSADNVAALAGLLGASWTLPESQADDIPPGGALVFELHEADRRGGEPFVRTFFVAQPDDAMRRAGTSSIVPVFSVPVRLAGCQSDDCPLRVFEAAAR